MDLGAFLTERLELGGHELVSLVGGGGKTTLMRALYHRAVSLDRRALAGTTTMVYAAQAHDLPGFLHGAVEADKLRGVAPYEVDRLFESEEHALVVIEADGSRSKVVKAPSSHEPPIPSLSTHVLALIGADAINRVIEDVAHRPMLVAALCGCGPYERLTPERARRLLTHASGGRKNVPAHARFTVVMTRTGPRQQDASAELAALLAEAGQPSIVLPLLAQSPGTGAADR